jgi:small-conductance mechanosensitive channel
MEKLNVFFEDYLYLENYFYAVGVFLASLLFIFLVKNILFSRIKKMTSKHRSGYYLQVFDAFNSIPSFFYYLLALYFPLKMVIDHQFSLKVIDAVFTVIVIVSVFRFLQAFVERVLVVIASRKTGEDVNLDNAFSGIKFIFGIIIWTLALLLILSNLGVDITSLVASLGIGSLAVALAVQNVLKDLFSSFSIYFDKPFLVGDNITIGDKQGVVKKIGLKSTRIETLQGEELIISNNELTTSQVQNFKKMNRRRVLMKLGLVYGTSLEDLKKINDYVKNIIQNVEGVEFGRSHFKEFGDFSLNFEIVYFVLSGDYSVYMDCQQKINFSILEILEKEGIKIAFPTQTVYVENG